MWRKPGEGTVPASVGLIVVCIPPEGCDEPEHHSSSGKAGPCAGAGRVPLPWPSVWQLLIGTDSAAVAGAQLQGTDRGQP